MTEAVLIALLLPLLGALSWFWVGPKFGEKAVAWGAVLALFGSFLSVVYLFFNTSEASSVRFFSWMTLNASQSIDFSFRLDPLSLVLSLVVTGVGTLIHIYAAGYMHGDPGFGRFFTYLNLFVFSMLMLTLSENMVGIFLGWEGVGACSYLLISFWFSETTNATAGKKAFVVNRVGDLGFLVAMFSLFKVFGTLSIPEILSGIQAGSLSEGQLFWTQLACFGLIIGAAGKSAQIPLYVWLPDAMAGPTPVSALIHAATMVTAGVYLACRLQPLFVLHLETLEILAYMGGLTAFFAASIGIFQNDIKKVLAYSTISQLGYMFLAVGLMAPVAAYFHLITHAFFKALLFLGAGSVIHGLHHEQDMTKMGGLRKKMPLTFWTMTIGVFAISGAPPLSGFVSKDGILHVAEMSHRLPLIVLAFATAFMTAFYMGRLWVMTFLGNYRGHHEAHESPITMTGVLIALAVLSVLGGLINWPHLWGGTEWLGHYLGSVVSQAPHENTPEAFWASIKLAAISAAIGFSGLGLAYFRYRNFSGEDFKHPSFSFLKAKYYIDELYELLFVENARNLGWVLWKGVDGALIDGTLNGTAKLATNWSDRLKRLQTGLAQQYAFWILVGVVMLLATAWTI